MKKVKLLGVLAASTMILAGCAGGNTSTSTEPTSTEPTSTSTETSSAEWSEADAKSIKDFVHTNLPAFADLKLQTIGEEDEYIKMLGKAGTDATVEAYGRLLEDGTNKLLVCATYGSCYMEEYAGGDSVSVYSLNAGYTIKDVHDEIAGYLLTINGAKSASMEDGTAKDAREAEETALFAFPEIAPKDDKYSFTISEMLIHQNSIQLSN